MTAYEILSVYKNLPLEDTDVLSCFEADLGEAFEKAGKGVVVAYYEGHGSKEDLEAARLFHRLFEAVDEMLHPENYA